MNVIDQAILDAAKKLIRNAYVDGGHCLDGVQWPDVEDLERAVRAKHKDIHDGR